MSIFVRIRNALLVATLTAACGSTDDAVNGGDAPTGAREPIVEQREAAPLADPRPATAPPPDASGLTARARAELLQQLQREVGPEFQLVKTVRSSELLNPAHGLRARFADGSLTLNVHRHGALHNDDRSETVNVALRGLGRGTELVLPSLRATEVNGNRLAFEREGGVSEWYLNGPGGLEHGLTLSERPQGDGPLVVDLAVNGDLHPKLEGDRVELRGPDGKVWLTYQDLFTLDARNTELKSAFGVVPGGIRIVVDDRNAVYPLVIDPNWVAGVSRLTQSFGSSSTHNVTMPATVDPGDLLVVLFVNDDTNSVSTPSGWTQLFTEVDTNTSNDNSEIRLGAYAKEAAGDEDGTSVNFATTGSGSSEEAAAHVYRIAAGLWDGPVADGVATATPSRGDSSSPNPPNLSPSWGTADTLWMIVLGRHDGGTVTAPADYATNHVTTNCNGSACGLASSWRRIVPGVSSENPPAFSLSQARDFVANTLAIRPATCADDAACDDGNPCTTDTCSNPGASGVCVYAEAPADTVCRASAGVCDPAETCGGSTTCPADALAPPATVCRPSVGVCDVAETCGGAATCPADAAAAPTTVCRAAAGVCDVAETCDGFTVCPADVKSTAVCRPGVGVCDLPDSCDGVANDCPADAKSTEVCRPAAGPCDLAEVCDGVANVCAGDSLANNLTVCRAAVDACDAPERCDGATVNCPADGAAAAGTPCGSALADDCTLADTCDGNFACQPNHVSDGATCGGACGTPGTCTDGVCSAAQTPCSDGDACNGNETCGEAACVAGTPLDCDDGLACTLDACGGSRCSHTPDDAACNTEAGEVCNRALGCSLCGNGTVDADEACDTGSDTEECDEDCSAPECGDGWVNAAVGEECDGTNLGGHTCESLGSGTGVYGVVTCNGCVLSTSECDADADGIADGADNCPNDANATQDDADADGIGDACDPVFNDGGEGGAGGAGGASGSGGEGGSGATGSGDAGSAGLGGSAGMPTDDRDGDGVLDEEDSCVSAPNPEQTDADGDGRGDCCDPTPGTAIDVATLSPDEPTSIVVDNTTISVPVGAVTAPVCVVVRIDPDELPVPENSSGDVIGFTPDTLDLDVPGEVCFWVGASRSASLVTWVNGEWVPADATFRNGQLCVQLDTLVAVAIVENTPPVVEPTEDAGAPPREDAGTPPLEEAGTPDAATEEPGADDDVAEPDVPSVPPVTPGPVDGPAPTPINTNGPSNPSLPEAGAPDAGPSSPKASDDGCGCRTVGHGASDKPLGALLLLAAGVALRRRRRDARA